MPVGDCPLAGTALPQERPRIHHLGTPGFGVKMGMGQEAMIRIFVGGVDEKLIIPKIGYTGPTDRITYSRVFGGLSRVWQNTSLVRKGLCRQLP